MAKEEKYRGLGDWMIFWFLWIIAIWLSLRMDFMSRVFYYAFLPNVWALIIFLLWIVVIFETFHIFSKKNRKGSSKKIKKQKSKKQTRKENAIASYFIVLLFGLFFILGFLGLKIFLIWLLVGVALIYWYGKKHGEE